MQKTQIITSKPGASVKSAPVKLGPKKTITTKSK